jgi:DNA-directed RNA polymerase subunit RPC12/RpoP
VNGLATVSTFRDLLDAQAAFSKLEDEGFECSLANEFLVGVAWHYSVAVGGVQLQVSVDQLALAIAALAVDESSELAAIEAEWPPLQPGDSCSECGSELLTIYRRSRYGAAAMLVVPLPFIVWGTRIKCKKCGHEWKPGVA